MKVLIIGGAGSIWMCEYIKQIHYTNHDDVTLTSFDILPNNLKQEYSKFNVREENLGKSHGIKGKIIKTANLLKLAFLSRDEKYDIIEIHCPPNNFQTQVFCVATRIIGCRLMLVFWGSDILRIDERKARRLEKLVKNADIINISTQEMKRRFEYFYGKKYENKLRAAKFGSLAFDKISEMKSTLSKKQCKVALGLNPEKTVIAIGYNGRKAQQHKKVLEELENLNKNEKENLILYFHMVECENKDYHDEVKEMLQALNIEYVMDDCEHTLEEISYIRMATDIFIHAQLTDALSSSIRECLYSEAILINPSWIKYSEYDEIGVEYIEYSDFNEIPQLIRKIIDRQISVSTSKNAKLLWEKYSWEAVRSDWMRIINEGAN